MTSSSNTFSTNSSHSGIHMDQGITSTTSTSRQAAAKIARFVKDLTATEYAGYRTQRKPQRADRSTTANSKKNSSQIRRKMKKMRKKENLRISASSHTSTSHTNDLCLDSGSPCHIIKD